jgi:hypothetical protein
MTHSGTTRGILRRTNASAHANPPCVTHVRVARLALPMTLAHLSTPLLGVADAAIIGRLGQAQLLGAIAASRASRPPPNNYAARLLVRGTPKPLARLCA